MHNQTFTMTHLLGIQINGDVDLVNRAVDLIVEGAKSKGDSEVLEQLHFLGYTY